MAVCGPAGHRAAIARCRSPRSQGESGDAGGLRAFAFFLMLCAPRRTLGRFYVRAEGAILGGIMKVTAIPEDARGCRMASSHAARNGLLHAATKATEAAATEATQAATAAPAA